MFMFYYGVTFYKNTHTHTHIHIVVVVVVVVEYMQYYKLLH